MGVDPLETSIAAVPAVQKLLNEQRLTVDDIDLFEVPTFLLKCNCVFLPTSNKHLSVMSGVK